MKWQYWLTLMLSLTNLDKSQSDDDLDINVMGTELIFLENLDYPKSYRFEDFFWTGSGDGANTIYKTTTIVSTVFLEISTTSPNNNRTSIETTEETINPTPTLSNDIEVDDYADREYWMITVLEIDNNKQPSIMDLKLNLENLYRIAFKRQQKKHLGLIRRRRKTGGLGENVRIFIHSVEKVGGNTQLVYHVTVGGKPVAALTAAKDMALISDEEVTQALGYPFVIKAEPYLKNSEESQSLAVEKNTWIFAVVAIIILLVILLILLLLLVKYKKKKTISSNDLVNRRQIFERGVGTDNPIFNEEETPRKPSPTYINFRTDITSDRQSTASSTSFSSPSMRVTPPPKPPRPKAAHKPQISTSTSRKIAPELYDSDDNLGEDAPDLVSPKSYLSMPSVRSFPRGGAMPVPLNKVLEPVSVLHLDMPDDEPDFRPHLIRHGSVGACEDPGVIGPVVWQMERGLSEQDLKIEQNASRMRRRLNELLDDTFTLFGSRRTSPELKSSYNKSFTALENRSVEEEIIKPTLKPRPKTSDLNKLGCTPNKPRRVWNSSIPSPIVRPISAGPTIKIEGFTRNIPSINRLGNRKCSLPGSTTDLKE